MSSSSSASQAQEGGSCWSDLPELLLKSIVLRLPYLSDILSFAAVCRSWHLFVCSSAAVRNHFISSHRPPLLLLPTNPYSFCSVEGDPLVGLKPLLDADYLEPHTIGLGCSQGYLILQQILEALPGGGGGGGGGYGEDVIRRRLVICDPFTGREILPIPPPLDDYPSIYNSAALSAPPDDDSSFLILLTLASVVYCRLGLDSNGEQHCSNYTVLHPPNLNVKHNPFYASSILPLKNRRKVYAINYKTDMLMELSVSESKSNQGAALRELGVKIHKWKGEGAPWIEYTTGGDNCSIDRFHFGPQLAELDGQLLLVIFLQNLGRSKGQLMWIQIHKMDFQEMKWTKAGHVLDDCALFIDTACGRCPVFMPWPEQWGGRRNCVYLADQERNTWKELQCHDGLLVPDYPSLPFILPERVLPRWPAPLWLHPSFLF